VSDWEPTDAQIQHVWSSIRRANGETIRLVLQAIHANPSLAGLDAPKLPTRRELEAIIDLDNIVATVTAVDRLIAAGYATEDEPDVPEFTEDDVRELALAMWPGNTYYDYNQTGMDMARRVLAAGYRKAKQ
jgi:hypothetical protein